MFFWNSLAFSMIQQMLAIWSLVPLLNLFKTRSLSGKGRMAWAHHSSVVVLEFQRRGLAAKLTELLEEVSERRGGFFVDLFVRVSNPFAVNMYKWLDYRMYTIVRSTIYSVLNGEPDEDSLQYEESTIQGHWEIHHTSSCEARRHWITMNSGS